MTISCEFAVIYGRRRVGKTALINEFTRDKDTIFFTGVETNAKQNLDRTKRIVLVIDEYPYVARASKSLASTLQLLIDKNRDRKR